MSEEMFKYEFRQLAVYEDGLTPVLLNEEQYRRARACVNACSGFSIEEVEGADFHADSFAAQEEIDALTKQRDDLLAALEKLQRRMVACTECGQGAEHSSIESWLDIANEAIASVKGGAA